LRFHSGRAFWRKWKVFLLSEQERSALRWGWALGQ
jgi:hypothetical protein